MLQLCNKFQISAIQIFLDPRIDAAVQLWAKMVFPVSSFTLLDKLN